MYIHEQRCLSLGVIQKEAGEFQGKPTPSYTALNFVVFDESSSRRAYLHDTQIISQALKYCEKWGTEFLVSGSIDEKGKLNIDDIEGVESMIVNLT